MKKIYRSIQKRIEKDLNEYIKWVILLGLYVFYHMLDNAYDEKKLVFLVIPLIFSGILVFLSDWIIRDLVYSASKDSGDNHRPKSLSVGVALLFYTSLVSFIVFYFLDWVPLINLGFLALLGTAILARYQDVATPGQEQSWNRWFSMVLITVGIAGLVHAFIFNNYLNVLTFVFYLGFAIYYFMNLYLFKSNHKN